MADVTFEELVPEVHALCPGAPIPLIVAKLREAAREFCEHSSAYRLTFDPVTVLPNIGEYSIDLPTGTLLVEVMSLAYDGVPLDPSSPDLLDFKLGSDWQTATGKPRQFFKAESNILRLVPMPNATGVLKLTGKVSLKPTRTATGIAEWFVDDYYEGIIAKASNLMLAMIGSEWFNGEMAGAFQAQYMDKLDNARTRANNDDTSKARVTTYGGY
jgi:hypothetical protein